MPTEIDLCNLALSSLGDSMITSFTEGTQRAQLCALHYPIARDSCLAWGAWKFARARAVLPRLAEAPAFGYSYAYQLPANPYCLHVLALVEPVLGPTISQIFGGSEDLEETPWTVEGRALLTDATACNILYVKRVEDTGAFAPDFTFCLIDILASQLAYAITGSHTAAQARQQAALAKLSEARAASGREGSPQRLKIPTAFTRVR